MKEESQIAEISRRIEELRSLICQEQEKLKTAVTELRNLDRVRSVFINRLERERRVKMGFYQASVSGCSSMAAGNRP